MKVLPRTQFGNPILRAKAKKVPLTSLKTAAFKGLVKQMLYTMRRVGGVGLAAPQIGKSIRLAVMEIRPTKTRPGLERSEAVVAINPRILWKSKAATSDWEGCLSLGGVRGKVPRAKKITVEYYDECGERVTAVAQGLWAAIFQHEIDHLEGVAFTDRMSDRTSLVALSEFKKRVLK